MGFFRIGIGRQISLGIGPITFYGGGRGYKRKPGCRICGRRTPYKVCRTCEKDILSRAPSLFNRMEALMKSINTENSAEQNKQAIKATQNLLSQLCLWETAGISLSFRGLTAHHWKKNFGKAKREFKRGSKTRINSSETIK